MSGCNYSALKNKGGKLPEASRQLEFTTGTRERAASGRGAAMLPSGMAVYTRQNRLTSRPAPALAKSPRRGAARRCAAARCALFRAWTDLSGGKVPQCCLKHRISKPAEAMGTKLKKGPRGPFSSFFMLPVGLADLIIAVTLI